jgi:pimeloyl-ACP methyl ester carboxylesterase
MTRRRVWVGATLGLLALVLAYYASLCAGLWASDRDALIAEYASPPSRFIVVDGVPLHVRDEGAGPVVVMLHGSIANLQEWNEVAARLVASYRVVRLDWPPYGLSGPDPTGVYSTARAAQLLGGVVDALQLPPFVLVATSNGGNVALEYYQRRPESVVALALSILPLERPSQTRTIDWRIRAMQKSHGYLLPDYRFRSWYRLIVEDTTPDPFTPTAAMIEPLFDMNNLPGALARQKQYIDSNTRIFKAGDAIARAAASVRVPVLLQWCDQDDVISQGPDATIRRFEQTQVELVRYADLGHFPMWEDPQRFTADLLRFLERVTRGSSPSPPAETTPPPG